MIDINVCLFFKCTSSCTFLTVIAIYYTAWHLNIRYRQFFQFDSFYQKTKKKLLSKKKINCMY